MIDIKQNRRQQFMQWLVQVIFGRKREKMSAMKGKITMSVKAGAQEIVLIHSSQLLNGTIDLAMVFFFIFRSRLLEVIL